MDEGVNVSALEFELVRYVWAISSTTLLTDLCYDKIRCHRNTSVGILTFNSLDKTVVPSAKMNRKQERVWLPGAP